jgi:chromosomal replication initiator protein
MDIRSMSERALQSAETPAALPPVKRPEIVGWTSTHKIQCIQHAIAGRAGITVAEMMGKRRFGKLIGPRQLAMYLVRHVLRKSYPAIGRKFGKRDHTTALSGIRKVERNMRQDSFFAQEVAELEIYFQGSFAGAQ